MLWEPHDKADRIVVISDLHLGVSDAFSQDIANRPLLVDFVEGLIEVGDVRELVIAGDFLDEWIVPLSYPEHEDSDAFFVECIANNREVFDALGKAIASGIKVVYVPGNHDMTLSEGVLAKALPGLVQARDAKGLGRYLTGDRHEIVVEHCHRYDVYSAPDTVSNRGIADGGDPILPPGYFYAQLGTEWVAEGEPSNVVDYPAVDRVPDSSDIDQLGAYLHYKIMTGSLLTQYTPGIGFEDKVFSACFDGLGGRYSEYDLCPRLTEDGTISSPTLYRDFQRTWDARQVANEVKVKNSFLDAATGTSLPEYFRGQASMQYLDDPDCGVEVVVFGHTHIPDYRYFGDNRFYVNSGTWIDINLDAAPDLTRTFALVTTGDIDLASLCRYEKTGTVTDISENNSAATRR